jgi:hypothetical protein
MMREEVLLTGFPYMMSPAASVLDSEPNQSSGAHLARSRCTAGIRAVVRSKRRRKEIHPMLKNASMVLLVVIALSARTYAQTPGTIAPAQPAAEPEAAPQELPAPPDMDAAGPEIETFWYGYQIMLVDAISVPLFLYQIDKADREPRPNFYLGLTGMAFGGAIVHAVHGRGRQALYSVGLRVGVPILTGLAVGQGDCGENSGICGFETAFAVAGLSFAAVAMVDWVFFSRDTRERPQARAASWSVTPAVAVSQGGARFGLAGSF